MERKIYSPIISVATALMMTDCGQTPAVQEKSGTEPADAQTNSPQNPEGTTQESLSLRTDIEPADGITFRSTREDYFAELCEGSTRETGIRVNVTCMSGYDDMVNKVMVGVVGKKFPDVAQLGQCRGLTQMYGNGYLLPAEGYVSKDIMDDILPGFWERLTYKDKKVILLFQNNVPMLYYSKTMSSRADVPVPKTMGDMISVTGEVKDVAGSYGFTFRSGYPWYIIALVYNSSAASIAGNKSQMSTESVKKIFKQVSQMANMDGSIPRDQHSTAQENFYNGKIGMLMTSYADYTKVEELVDGRFETALTFSPRVNTMDITMGGNGLGLFKTVPGEQKAATMFVEFMLDGERVASNCPTSGYVPVTNGATDTETYRKYLEGPNCQVVNEQLPYLGGTAANPADSSVWSGIISLADSAGTEPDVGLDRHLVEADDRIEKYPDEYAGE